MICKIYIHISQNILKNDPASAVLCKLLEWLLINHRYVEMMITIQKTKRIYYENNIYFLYNKFLATEWVLCNFRKKKPQQFVSFLYDRLPYIRFNIPTFTNKYFIIQLFFELEKNVEDSIRTKFVLRFFIKLSTTTTVLVVKDFLRICRGSPTC